jgi:hypothetical protein
MVTPEGQTVHYRPIPATGMRSGDYEALMEHSSNTYPHGLVNAASEYTARIPHLFVDPTKRDHVLDLYMLDLPEPEHPAPTVNVVEIRQIGDDSLSTIPEESIGYTRPHGTTYTCTLINLYGEDFSAFPPSFGGDIFVVSNDEPPCDGEWTWRMPKRMRQTQAQMASATSTTIWPTHSTCATTSKFSRHRAPTLPSP